MSYNREDIELMITNMPRNGQISSLYVRIEPQRKHRISKNIRIPFHTIPRKIIISLIDYFQEDPNDIKNKSWINSGIPYFLNDVKLQHSADSDVQRLFEIPNIERLGSGQMD
jgi:hypothetical protein